MVSLPAGLSYPAAYNLGVVMFEQDTIVISHLVALRQGWSEGVRSRAHLDYVRFLAAAADGGAGRPSLEADAIWHEHILHSESYVRYCDSHFGRYIHHAAQLPLELAPLLRARLGEPLPDFVRVAPFEAGGGLANCGAPSPDEPQPPEMTRLANCGAPDDPGPPPEVRLANCGAPTPVPHQSPPPPPPF